ncbi:MAG TPA: hypothetical protein VF032_14860 [Thermoleophilaceae bacterium]
MSVVVVAGALANKVGVGGEPWFRMSWIRGFERLGLDVRFVEELAYPEPAALAWFSEVMERFEMTGRATLLAAGVGVAGPSLDDLLALAPDATLVNMSGHLAPGRLFDAFRRRVFVDADPGFTQIWHEQGDPGARLDGHDLHFTIGELIGTPGCPVPTSGIDWKHVRQPVVLEDWPATPLPELDRFTTVASWRAPFGSLEYGGRTYGLKHHEFRKVMELPRRSPQRFELALDIHPAEEPDLRALRENGWVLVDPRAVARTPDEFRSYVQGSGAEFSVAQGVYVGTGCAWFSDRTVRYLASGKPALVQDTGFSRTLPVGEGLVPFSNLEEAVAGAADIAARYEEHCSAARRIAEEHFAAELVLARFCEEAGIQP